MFIRKGFCIFIICFLCLSSFVWPHFVMGPVEVNRILKSLQKSRKILDGQPSQEDRKKEIFNIAFEAYTLMKLINTEIEAHGDEQQGLINLSVKRSQDMKIGIGPIKGKPIYVYDFKEFEEYLKIAPQGKYAAEARFALIERAFYQQSGGEKTPENLLANLEEKRQFLEQYPDFSMRSQLEMLLTLDYYQLYFLYLERNDVSKTKKYGELVLEQCRHIMDTFPGTQSANFAMNLMLEFGSD